MDDLDKLISDCITIRRNLVPILAQIKGCSEDEMNNRIYALAVKHNMPLERVKLMLASHPEVVERAKTFLGD